MLRTYKERKVLPSKMLRTYAGKCRECGNVMEVVAKGDACMYCGSVGTLRNVKDIKKKGRGTKRWKLGK